ncbi:MAG: transcriptional regulator [Bacteroidetes bacterium]|nr:transcriptional regulator [Bacteroidota bacterium]
MKPIKTKKDYEAALKRIGETWNARPGTEEADELDILATLVDHYESLHFPIEPPDPVSAIEFRLEQLGLQRSALNGIIGSRGRVSEVMNGKRSMTLKMIRKLHKEFNIPYESLIDAGK